MLTTSSNASRMPRNAGSRVKDRGGIRKRNITPMPSRLDRDGDVDMDAPLHNKRRRRRNEPMNGRGKDGKGQGSDKEKTLDAIQKAVFGGESNQANIRQGSKDRTRDGGLVRLTVRGWKDSKASSNADGGIESLIGFIERKATSLAEQHTKFPRVKISKSRVRGDILIISLRPEHAVWVQKINGFKFAGAPLTIEEFSGNPTDDQIDDALSSSHSTADTRAKMTAVLAKRYIPQTKVLNLSALGSDPDLVSMGIFNSMSTESKFFPALMRICESNFETTEKRYAAIISVSLADNDLQNVSVVTTLAQTFPQLKNLDMSGNKIASTRDIEAWRWKFRDLDFLDLSRNPISVQPEFKETMMKWFPKLRTLNNVQVRTDEEIALSKRTPIPVVGPSFHDESQIAENFVKAFFVGYDTDRNDIVKAIYDAQSTFSLNVNTSAPRVAQSEAGLGWDPYIRKSRNLQRLTQLPARMNRLYIGADKIREVWNELPKTKHPDILTSPQDWLIECHPIPGLPDLSGQSSMGVGGLLITVHGKFEELDQSKGLTTHTRSFDRTFIIGQGTGFGGLRVVNDMLTLRAYGGSEAWIPDSEKVLPVPVPVATSVPGSIIPPGVTPPPSTIPAPVHPEAKDGYGMPIAGKLEEQLKQEQLVLDVSFRTKMTLEFSHMALSGNGWNLEAALKNFGELNAQGQLPPTAFLPV